MLAGRHAHQQLLHHAAIQRIGVGEGLKGRERDFAVRGAVPWPGDDDRASAEHDLAGHGARPRRGPVRLVRVARPTQRGAGLLEQRPEHLHPRSHHQFEALGLGVDEAFNERERPDGGGRC
jgi:hypothetical protein